MGAWLAWIPLLLAPLAFRKGWAGALLVLILLELAPAPAEAGVLDAFARPDQRGARAFADGRYAESAQAFEDPAWQAAARYRAGDFTGASETLTQRTDPVSQYNLGNALAKSGQLEPALAAYERALAAAPTDADARFNRDLVKRLLEQQAQQQQQQQSGQQSQDSQSSQDPSQSGAGGEQEPKQGEKSDQQDQGEGSQASESPGGSQASASDRGEKAEDAGAEAEAEQQANAANADSEAKAQDAGAAAADAQRKAEANAEAGARGSDASAGKDASGSPADPPSDAAQGVASAEDGDPDGAPHEPGTPAQGRARPLDAQEQEHAQWMARLPDDPGGLLREKIRRDYQRKQAARHGEEAQ